MRDVSRWRRPERVYTDISSVCFNRGEHIISVRLDELHALDAMVDFVGADVTFVSFHAALNKRTFSTPYFTGATLAARKANRILVSDPSLSEDVLLAWFAGSRAISFDLISAFVAKLIALAGAPRVVFFGGSGGGFAALNLARLHPGSSVIVANPQTDILKFYPRWWSAYGRHSWGLSGDDSSIAVGLGTLVTHDLVGRYAVDSPDVNIVYLQNQNDLHHIEHHQKPFMDAVDPARMRLIVGDWGPGHARPPKEQLIAVVDEVLSRSRNS